MNKKTTQICFLFSHFFLRFPPLDSGMMLYALSFMIKRNITIQGLQGKTKKNQLCDAPKHQLTDGRTK